ncbi:DUF3108 domain-containing protein [Catenovulum sp. SM1970]|uniref:DUF3108 domain-containing protein n=1 Tax=Marinifaba aquimaris TaxID=2741323 RepID=UPI0015736629|nr:DUF3108 domain-containing protein [Marinifaba aquimaris]NTS76059.1 DUF3108 domain-containing protein [Marinifaba aquimaris]
MKNNYLKTAQKRFKFKSYLSACVIVFACNNATAAPTTNNNKIQLSNNAPTSTTPFIAKYKVSRGSLSLGTAKRQLSQIKDDEYVFSYASDLSFLILSDERAETSQLKISDDKLVQPLKYRFKREGTGSNTQTILEFDPQTGKVKDVNLNREVECEEEVHWLDQISYQLQLKLDLEQGKQSFSYYFIDDEKKEKHYEFVKVGKEKLTLPAGDLDTIKLVRQRNNKKRVTELWFAPELGNLLVRIRQTKNGDEQLDAQLKSAKFK